MNLKFYPGILQNRNIRLIVGVLIALQGLINLSSILPLRIASVVSSIQVSELVRENAKGIITQSILSNTFAIIIILCQIALGLYFVKHRNQV